MELSKQLILFRYILRQFGYEEFEVLREEFNNKEQGVSATGYTYFASCRLPVNPVQSKLEFYN